jgi:hypothetical protein
LQYTVVSSRHGMSQSLWVAMLATHRGAHA